MKMGRHPSRRSHIGGRARWRRLLPAALVLAVVVASLAPAGSGVPAEAAPSPGIRKVAQLPIPHELVNPIPVPYAVGRRLYAVAATGIRTYDLDSLQVTGELLTARVGQPSDALLTAPVFEPSIDAVVTGETRVGTGTGRLLAFGLRNGTLQQVGAIDLSAGVPPGSTMVGMARAPGSPWLYVATAQYRPTVTGPAAVPGTVWLSQIDIRDFFGGRAAAEWTVPLPHCLMPVGRRAGRALLAGLVAYVRAAQSVYVGCDGHTVQEVYRPPVAGGIARVRLENDPAVAPPPIPTGVELLTRSGDFSLGDTAVDSGSGRLVMSSYSPGHGTSAFVFDGPSAGWIGGTKTDELRPSGMAVDQASGRVYLLSENKLLTVSELRGPTVQQGVGYEDLGIPTNPMTLAVDSGTRRLFITWPDALVVLQDDVPVFVPFPGADPDDNTVDMAEQPGATTANYNASAQGYGALFRAVGGVESLQHNVAPFDANQPTGTRELHTAYLESLSLANAEATAELEEVGRDRYTQANEGGAPAGTPSWPYPAVRCTDDSGRPADVQSGGAEVSCDSRGATVRATVATGAVSGDAVSIARSALTATARRESAKGMHVRVDAAAEGVSVRGPGGVELLRVGSVAASAEAWAHGRPGTAGTSFSGAVLRDVVLQGRHVCGAHCDPQAVADAVNGRLSGTLRVTFPKADPAAAAGSPGGFQAEVRRSAMEHLGEVELNDQAPDRIEVPAMVLTLFADNTKRFRTVVRLAAVEAEARYGIVALPRATDDAPPTDTGATEEGSAQAEVGLLGGVLLVPSTPDQASVQAAAVSSVRNSIGRGSDALSQLVRLLRNPLRLLWNGDPLLTFVMWAALLSPVYLSARRRLMLHRTTVSQATGR